MAKVDIWMPVYIGDYLSDTMDLTTEEHGCYLLLLMHYWKKGQLTDDIGKLLKITGLSTEKKNILTGILNTYFQHEDNCFRHKRVEKELRRREEIVSRIKRHQQYSLLLQDLQWQKRRKEILSRDGWCCRLCGKSDGQLHVHHLQYLPGHKPWEYKDDDLITLCASCHYGIHHDS